MKITKVWAVYFSATGTTEKVVLEISDRAAQCLGTEREIYDFTLPGMRENGFTAQSGELVLFGTPVYAGRVPNVLLKYLATIRGNSALAVPVVVFGNRNFDDALIELRDILQAAGFVPIAAGAFVGAHAFSDRLAAGRPDEEDLREARGFAEKISEKIQDMREGEVPALPQVPGTPHPYRPYYQPRDRYGNSIDILKVKPVTSESCDHCGTCAAVCPMGSIDQEDVRHFTGICIKCGACVKKCPKHAKYYEDEGYLYHRRELEELYSRRASVSLFW